MSGTARAMRLSYEVVVHDDWTLPEVPVPESQPHDLALDLLKALLLHWVQRTGTDGQVARNLAVRWDESRPTVGIDPDLCLIAPSTPEGAELASLCTWKAGHTAPRVAVEVVSRNHPYKDYLSTQERYAASGTTELWVFDADLAGPKAHGGPHRLQLWHRDAAGDFVRVYAGPGPVFSPALGAWLLAVDEGRRLRISEDGAGTRWWMTGEEAERTAKEAALAEAASLRAELDRVQR
ncbi:MAG: Uma2 family endonuclease [Polyangiaceae bacterium]